MNFDTIIIGAGLSGLSAAGAFEEFGRRNFVVLERDATAGGRVKTIELDGFHLDLGFQVGLSSYPAFRDILPLRKLKPCYFGSGALVEEKEGELNLLAHPLMHPGKIAGGLMSRLPLSDRVRLVGLVVSCLFKSDDSCLRPVGLTTSQYLKKRGFSDRIIEVFIRPFFGSIFLDQELTTDASLFCYYLKRFALGRAFLPRGGVSRMSEVLLENIDKDKIRYQTEVEEIVVKDDGIEVHLTDASVLKGKRLILATDPSTTCQLMNWPEPGHRSTRVVYLSSVNSVFDGPWIVLPSVKDRIAQHFIQITNVDSSLAPPGRELVSATVIDDRGMPEDELVDKVKAEIERLFPETARDLELVKVISVPKALPAQGPDNLEKLSDLKLPNGVFLAGDLVSNASLQNALQSGREAALKAMDRL